MNGLNGELEEERLPGGLASAAIRVIGVLGGALLGGIAWIALAVAVCYAARWADPNDPSAGSVSIIVSLTVPVGCLIGAAIAASIMTSHPAKRVEVDLSSSDFRSTLDLDRRD